jgi:twitching motility protein PilT
MRRALRQDPDVILLGEMRDLETTSAAITAAETGHLVFGTLHTTGAARTVDRIIDQYPTDQQEQIRSQLAVSHRRGYLADPACRRRTAGRIAAFEVMIMNSAIENHIRKGETFKIRSAIQTGKRQGNMLLDDTCKRALPRRRSKEITAIERRPTCKRDGGARIGADTDAERLEDELRKRAWRHAN